MKQIDGLKILPRDKRDIKLGQVMTLPDISELPYEFRLIPFKIKRQIDFQGTNTDMCSAFSSTSCSELQENIELEPTWSFAVSKIGDLKSWGNNLRNACKPHTKFGAIEKQESPYNLENKTADFVRNIENWPNLYNKAILHKKKSYVFVDGGFNDIKAYIWKFKAEKRGVMIGLLWGWPLQDVIIDKESEQGFGHAVLAIGFQGDYLIILNSYGEEAGDKGFHYIHKDIINNATNRYGAFAFVDMDAELLKKETWTLYQKVLDLMWKLFEKLKRQVEIKQEEMIKVISDEIPPVKPIIESPKYLWDTKEQARYSVRVICDEEGLSTADKNLITAIIACESGFNTKAIHKNNNSRKSTDWGICQFNDYWYIGEGKPIASVDEALNNPTLCVKVLISQHKKGRLNDWICYKNGMYKAYL